MCLRDEAVGRSPGPGLRQPGRRFPSHAGVLVRAALAGAGLLFVQTSEAASLRIGLVPEQNIFKQVERYEPIAAQVLKASGISLTLVTLPSYDDVLEQLRRGELDGAFLGSYAAALGIRQLGLEVVARPVSTDGSSTYRGYLFVRTDSGIRTVADMKGKVLALVSPATTAGYLFPMAYLRAQGVRSVPRHFSERFFAGSHDGAIRAVLSRKADVGCAKSSAYEQLAEEDPRVRSELTILARSEAVPSNGLALRTEVPAATRLSLSRALLIMHESPEGRRQLARFGAERFIPVRPEDYDVVYAMAARAGMPIAAGRAGQE